MNKFVVIVLIVVVIGIGTAFLFREDIKGLANKAIVVKYFKADEFDSRAIASIDTDAELYEKNGKSYIKNSGAKNMAVKFMYMIDKARDTVEKDWNKANPDKKIVFKVNSGYRTQHYNDTLEGSAKDSAHIAGKAVDLDVSSYNEEQKKVILKALYEVGFRRFGFMENAIHVDNDETKTSPALWDYGVGSMAIINPETLVNN